MLEETAAIGGKPPENLKTRSYELSIPGLKRRVLIMARDFSKARKKAREAGDAAVGDKLDEVTQQASNMEEIFDELKLTDQATYDELIKIVEDATSKNQSVASVVDRLKDLGKAGKKLAGSITRVASESALDIASGGSLGALRKALKLKS